MGSSIFSFSHSVFKGPAFEALCRNDNAFPGPSKFCMLLKYLSSFYDSHSFFLVSSRINTNTERLLFLFDVFEITGPAKTSLCLLSPPF